MSRPPDIDALFAAALRGLVVEHMSRVSELSAMVIELGAEIARLKGLKERRDIKPPATPSGMDKASRPMAYIDWTTYEKSGVSS